VALEKDKSIFEALLAPLICSVAISAVHLERFIAPSIDLDDKEVSIKRILKKL